MHPARAFREDSRAAWVVLRPSSVSPSDGVISEPARRSEARVPGRSEINVDRRRGRARPRTRALPIIVTTPRDPTARRDALYWRLALRRLPRRRRHGAASQALPRARRRLRSAACGDAHRHSAARARLQRAGGAGGGGRIAAAMGVEDAAQGLYDLIGRLGARRALREIGMPEDGVEQQRQRTIDALPKPDKLIRHRQAAPSDQIRLPATPSSLLSRDDPCRRAPRNSGICALGVKRSILTTSPVRPIMIEARN